MRAALGHPADGTGLRRSGCASPADAGLASVPTRPLPERDPGSKEAKRARAHGSARIHSASAFLQSGDVAAPGPRIKARPPNPAPSTQVVQVNHANVRGCKLKARGPVRLSGMSVGSAACVKWDPKFLGRARTAARCAHSASSPFPAALPRRCVPRPCRHLAWRLISELLHDVWAAQLGSGCGLRAGSSRGTNDRPLRSRRLPY